MSVKGESGGVGWDLEKIIRVFNCESEDRVEVDNTDWRSD